MIFHLGCHLSVLLTEEQAGIRREKVEEVIESWKDQPIKVKIKWIYLYKKFDYKKGWLILLALTVESEDLLRLREDLGQEKNPAKLNTHIT